MKDYREEWIDQAVREGRRITLTGCDWGTFSAWGTASRGNEPAGCLGWLDRSGSGQRVVFARTDGGVIVWTHPDYIAVPDPRPTTTIDGVPYYTDELTERVKGLKPAER